MCVIVARKGMYLGTYGKFCVALCFSLGYILGFRGTVSPLPNGAQVNEWMNEYIKACINSNK